MAHGQVNLTLGLNWRVVLAINTGYCEVGGSVCVCLLAATYLVHKYYIENKVPLGF